MGLFAKKVVVPEEKSPSTSELSPEERQEIERLLDEGLMPLGVSKQTGIDIKLIRTIKLQRDNLRARTSPTATPRPMATSSPSSPSSLERVSKILSETYERELIEEQIDALKKSNRHKQSLWALELADRALELQRKKQEIELEALYDPEPTLPSEDNEMLVDAVEEPAESPSLPGPLAEYSWILDIIKFWTMLGNKGAKPTAQQTLVETAAPSPTSPTIDATKPFSIEEIRKQIAQSSPAERELAKKLPAGIISRELKKRFPGITPENIKTVVHEIRHYVDNSERIETGNQQLQ